MATKFVAEVSSNHHQDLDRCLAFIDAAADLDCEAVKFQLFKIEELFAPEVLAQSVAHKKRRQWELPLDFLPALAERCRKRSIQFACTPFYLEGVEVLKPYVDFYKIASYELLWDRLLIECGETGKPVVLSTGMSTIPEIDHAVEVLRVSGCADLTLLHCVSGYPAPIGECNLAAIETLRTLWKCPVGWSDHSVSPAVLTRAVHRWGASMVEFHLDLDRSGEEYEAGHCWLPAEIGPVIRTLKESLSADGTGIKEPTPSEQSDRSWRADPLDGLRPLREVRKTWNVPIPVH